MSECYFTPELARVTMGTFESEKGHEGYLIYRACREIIRLSEENEKLHKVIDKLQATMPVILTGKDGEYVCMNCGANMQYAKRQCPECE